jgi:hypothetical protein
VFLMIAKPDTVMSMVVLAVALGVSTLVTLPIGLVFFSQQEEAR